MAKKPTGLDAQMMPFTQCMTMCLVDSSAYAWLALKILAPIFAILIACRLFWAEITTGFTLAFQTVWSMLITLNLDGLFMVLVYALYTTCITWAQTVYEGVVNITSSWPITWLWEHYSRSCTTTGEAEQLITSCTLSQEPLNFLALAAASVPAILINAACVIVFIGTVHGLWKRTFNRTRWLGWQTQRQGMKEAYICFIAITVGVVVSALLAGPMGQFVGPSYLAAYPQEDFHALFLLLLPFFLLVGPIAWTSSNLAIDLRENKEELQRKLGSFAINDDASKARCQSLHERIEALAEDTWSWVVRFALFVLGTFVFLAGIHLGYTIAPEGWKVLGIVISGILMFLVVAVALSGLITCYIHARGKVQKLVQDIKDLEQDAAAVK